MSTSVLENIKRVTQATTDALNAWNYDALVAIRSEDFIFQGLPRSLGLPAMNNEQYRELFFNILTPAFKSFKLTPLFTTYDAAARKATLHVSASAETPIGHREWELIQLLDFSESGEKVTRLQEFFDSKDYLDMMQSMQQQHSS